jgi:hypothetical protein
VHLDAGDADGHPVLGKGGLDRHHPVILVECDASLGQQVADGERLGGERARFAVGDECVGGKSVCPLQDRLYHRRRVGTMPGE